MASMGDFSFLNSLRNCYRAKIITVEIVCVLYIMGKMISVTLFEQYYYHKFGSVVLQNTSFEFPNGSFCVSSELINSNTGSNDSYKVVESQSNHLVAYLAIAMTIPSMVVTVVIGPLMDRYGRKIGILLPVTGTMLMGILSVLIIQFDLHPYYFFIPHVVNGLTGGFTCVLASCFAYIADVGTPRWRSLRIGIVESGIAYGGAVGTLLGGFWLHKINCNFVLPMLFFVGCNVVILVYTVFFIPESLSRSERKEMVRKNPKGPQTYIQGFKIFCGGLPVRSTWMLYVATICITVMGINQFGAVMIDVYFLKALPFDFNAFQIGIYEGVRAASQGTANSLLMAILVALCVGDAWIMLLATLFHVATGFLIGFSNLAWQLYAIASVKGVEGISWSAARSLMSKLVRPEQQGALFSIIASIESGISLLASAVWPLVFPLTLQHDMRAGTTYIIMAAFGATLFPLIISLIPLKKEFEAKTKPAMDESIKTPLLSDKEPLLDSDQKYAYQAVNS